MENSSYQNSNRPAPEQRTTAGSWCDWIIGWLKGSRGNGKMRPAETVESAELHRRQPEIDGGGNDKAPPATRKLPSLQSPLAANKSVADLDNWAPAAGDLRHVVEAEYELLKNLNECTLWAANDEHELLNNMTYSQSAEVISNQKDKFNQMWEKRKVRTESFSKMTTNFNDSSPEGFFTELNNKIDKCKSALDMISSEKMSLVQTNRNLAEEINSLKSKLVATKRYERKYYANKNDVKALKMNIKELKSHTVKDLEVIKNILRALEEKSTAIGLNNVSNEKINRKHEKLKMRLKVIEKDVAEKSLQTVQQMMVMPGSFSRGEANESVPTTLNFGEKVRQQSSGPPAPPPPPPAPPLGPPAPAVASSAQFQRYSINTDVLREMTKELRKPDCNNVRKIPVRADMKISKKIVKAVDQVLQPPAPDSSSTAEAPSVTPEPPTRPLPSTSAIDRPIG